MPENEYICLIEVSVTANSPKEAAKYAMDDLRDPSLGPWNVRVTTYQEWVESEEADDAWTIEEV